MVPYLTHPQSLSDPVLSDYLQNILSNCEMMVDSFNSNYLHMKKSLHHCKFFYEDYKNVECRSHRQGIFSNKFSFCLYFFAVTLDWATTEPNTKYHLSLLNSLTYHTIKNYDHLIKRAVIHMLSATSLPSSKSGNQGISAFGKSRIGKEITL